MDLLLEHKWFLLVANEVLFWALLALFLTARYVLGLRRASLVFVGLFAVDIVILAALAVLVYARTGEFGTFGTVAVALIVYALIWGAEDLKKLDAYLERKMGPRGGQAPPEVSTGRFPVDPEEKARDERRGWYGHLAIFVIGQGILVAVGASWLSEALGGTVPEGPSGLVELGHVWTLVFLVDTVWSLSYTVFPGRKGVR